MPTVVPYRQGAAARDERVALSDASLVRAVADGELRALGALYDRYHRDVYAFLCRAIAVYGADLEDLVQDTFLAVVGSARRFRARSQVKTWLFGIAINVGRNYIRVESRRRGLLRRVPAMATASPRPDDCAQSAQQLSRVADAIADLSPLLREAYVANVIEGLSSADAARVLGVRKGTLWRRVHEARTAIAHCIGREQEV